MTHKEVLQKHGIDELVSFRTNFPPRMKYIKFDGEPTSIYNNKLHTGPVTTLLPETLDSILTNKYYKDLVIVEREWYMGIDLRSVTSDTPELLGKFTKDEVIKAFDETHHIFKLVELEDEAE